MKEELFLKLQEGDRVRITNTNCCGGHHRGDVCTVKPHDGRDQGYTFMNFRQKVDDVRITYSPPNNYLINLAVDYSDTEYWACPLCTEVVPPTEHPNMRKVEVGL